MLRTNCLAYEVRELVRRSAGGVAAALIVAVSVAAQTAFPSDDFNTCGGPRGSWVFLDPLGTSTVEILGAGTSDARLAIDVAAGQPADAWHFNAAPRLMQTTADEDFVIEAKIDLLPSKRYQLAGVLVEQDADNWLRFDIYSSGNKLWSFTGSTAGGVSSSINRESINATGPVYVRVTRAGDLWTHEYSFDGQSWSTNVSFERTLAVTSTGLFAGNAGPSPAFHAEFDYIFEASDPMVPEDGNPTGGPSAITVSTTGVASGLVQLAPDLPSYSCGEVVTVTALPDSGAEFAGWSGALEGMDNPATIVVGSDADITARFDPEGPPVIAGVAVDVGVTCAVVTWDTNKPATSRVDYGPTVSYGDFEYSSELTTSHMLVLSGLQADSLYHFAVTSVSLGGQPASSSDLTFQTLTSVGPSVDDFNRCAGPGPLWTVEDPLGGSSVSTVGVGSTDAMLRIDVPGGESRDAWDTNNSVRIMQFSDDRDFELEVAFQSVPIERYQIQGLLIEESADRWLRFDFYSDGSALYAFAAATVGGDSSKEIRKAISASGDLRMRVRREGDLWTQLWSTDGGQSWDVSGSFMHAIGVARVGIFAGTAGQNPAFTVEADYFWLTSEPMDNEDGSPAGGPMTLTSATSGSGSGTVTADPSKPSYDCGESVTITAVPDPGSVFTTWEGVLAGEPNPVVVAIGDDLHAIARFESATPPTISNVAVVAGVSGASISWDTDKLATSRIDFGVTPALGNTASDSTLTVDHALLLPGLQSNTEYYFTVTSVDWQGQPTTTALDSFWTLVSLGPQSDDFNRCEGVASFWSMTDPVGGATVDVLGAGTSQAALVIELPAGSDRDAWDVNEATRLMQPADDEDFVLEASFTSVLDTAYQIEGVLVEQDEDNWLRFDFHSDGAQVRAFSARTLGGDSAVLGNTVISSAVPLLMRVERVGDSWTQLWSSDSGQSWVVAAAFEQPLQVAEVGVFAGVAGPAPAFTMVCDYFFDVADPIVPEDGPIDGGPFTIDVPADGSVVVEPDLLEYYCGQEVTIRALPGAGEVFSSWTGDLAGFGEVAVLKMGMDLAAAPVFEPTPAPTITDVIVAAGSSSALVTWTTDLPSDSRVDYGLTPVYGLFEEDANMVVQHSIALLGLAPETVYHFKVTSTSDGGLSSSSADAVFATNALGSSISTDFNHPNLDVTRWSFQDPIADSMLRLDGYATADAHLVLEVPAGSEHDIWDSNDSVRVVQLVDDVDLDVATKLESTFDSSYQMQGLVFVGATADDFVRVEFHHNGSQLKLFAATTVAANSRAELSTDVWSGPWLGDPLYLRVKRAGDTWSVYWSLAINEAVPSDEASWVLAGSFSHAIALTGMGLFAGNTGATPGHVARFDWIVDVLDPVLPEDGQPEPDTEPPYRYRERAIAMSSDSATIRWYTDESATGYVNYGLTTNYELGPTPLLPPSYGQETTLFGLLAETVYHYQIVADDGQNVSTSGDLMFETPVVGGGPGPVFSMWYASAHPNGSFYQSFGQAGLAQPLCNILGHVYDADGSVETLEYSLNSGPMIPLSMGPDTRRLLLEGDFNVDLVNADLVEGLNTVQIRATDNDQNTTQITVNVDFTSSTVSSLDGVVDWTTVTNIADVAQVIDGKWAIENDRLRAVEIGYDRFVGFGDYRWSDFEIEVPVTVYEVDPSGFLFPSNGPLVGFALRWPGHTDNGTNSQPNTGFWPMGALAMFRWEDLTPMGFCQMRGNSNTAFAKVPCNLELGVEYALKARVTTNPDGSTKYQFKMWPSANSEVDWLLEFVLPAGDPQDPFGNPAQGSLGLLSHHVDAHFGDVIVTQLDDQ